jgi:hypothetical protein
MNQEAEKFWNEYSARLGEKVLRFSLGRYVSGVAGLDGVSWGLVIVTDAGLRFHHFPHENWMSSLIRVGGNRGQTDTEKSFFIPKGRILGSALIKEKSLLNRILSPSVPRLVVRYSPEDTLSGELTMIAEIDRDAEELADALANLISPHS